MHSIRKSTNELAAQQSQLREQSQQLLKTAENATAPAARQRIEAQAQQLADQAKGFWKASPRQLFFAGILYAAAMLPASLYWKRCLVALQQISPRGSLLDVLWAYFYGNLGKYFPGKAMVFVLRLAALEHHGVKKVATSITILMETLTMMSVGGATAAVCLIALNLDWRLTVLAVGLLACTIVPTCPPMLKFLLPRLQRGVEAETIQRWGDRLTWRLFFRGWAMLCVTWIANGLSLFFVLKSLPSAELDGSTWSVLFLSACGACALAVVLGFVSLIPGGAGVREVVISMVLSPVVGPVAALCCALWMRIVWLATELAIVTLLALVRTVSKVNDSRSRIAPA